MRRSVAAVVSALLLALAGSTGVPVSAGATSAPTAATETSSDERRVAGRRLVIPRIGVDAGIIPVGVNSSGALAVGRSVSSVYRWRHGVVAGEPGSAVLAGHTWSQGAGVFDRLGQLRRGDRVRVGAVRFRVVRVRRVTRMSREEVRQLFSDRGEPRLVLITCGDRNNTTGVYRTRIIVNARKV